MTDADDSHAPLLHPLLAARWSPTRFDESATVGTAELDSILDAARWAPSAGNSQPWAFVVGRRGDDMYGRLVRHLAGSSATWAATASMLIANLCHRYVEDTDWDYSEFALYDLGQAVAHMTVQAQSLGLHTRQFRAFDRAGLEREFAVPPHWQVTTMSALGRVAAVPADPQTAGNDAQPRQRRTREQLRWSR